MQPNLFVCIDNKNMMIPVPDFPAVEEYRDTGRLNKLGVSFADFHSATVDLDSGEIQVGDDHFLSKHPGQPLRPIYYKLINAESGTLNMDIQYVALGWQTTSNGRNYRFGVKLYPEKKHYELTEDI